MKKNKSNDAISKLEASLSKESVSRAHDKANEILFQINLADLRKEAGLTQQDIKEFSQSGLSKIESRSDIKISTLRTYLHSIGMELEIKARKRKGSSRAKNKEYILLKE